MNMKVKLITLLSSIAFILSFSVCLSINKVNSEPNTFKESRAEEHIDYPKHQCDLQYFKVDNNGGEGGLGSGSVPCICFGFKNETTNIANYDGYYASTVHYLGHTFPTPSKEGYKFVGYYINDSKSLVSERIIIDEFGKYCDESQVEIGGTLAYTNWHPTLVAHYEEIIPEYEYSILDTLTEAQRNMVYHIYCSDHDKLVSYQIDKYNLMDVYINMNKSSFIYITGDYPNLTFIGNDNEESITLTNDNVTLYFYNATFDSGMKIYFDHTCTPFFNLNIDFNENRAPFDLLKVIRNKGCGSVRISNLYDAPKSGVVVSEDTHFINCDLSNCNLFMINSTDNHGGNLSVDKPVTIYSGKCNLIYGTDKLNLKCSNPKDCLIIKGGYFTNESKESIISNNCNYLLEGYSFVNVGGDKPWTVASSIMDELEDISESFKIAYSYNVPGQDNIFQIQFCFDYGVLSDLAYKYERIYEASSTEVPSIAISDIDHELPKCIGEYRPTIDLLFTPGYEGVVEDYLDVGPYRIISFDLGDLLNNKESADHIIHFESYIILSECHGDTGSNVFVYSNNHKRVSFMSLLDEYLASGNPYHLSEEQLSSLRRCKSDLSK